MAENDSVSLSQDEINRVLKTVRRENAAHDRADADLGMALSQAELDRLFAPSAPQPASAPEPADFAPLVQTEPPAQAVPAPGLSPEEKRAAKIAERKARAAALLAKVNAASPKRLFVLYGSTLLSGSRYGELAAGSVLELDRAAAAAADILVDDKVVARGILETKDGHASVRITELLSRPSGA